MTQSTRRPPSPEDTAIQKAVREAVLQHARAGRAVPEWRDGKIVWVQPDEILARFGGDSLGESGKQPMRKLIVDDNVRVQLRHIRETVELCDKDSNPLGTFVPAEDEETRAAYMAAMQEVSEGELGRSS